MGTPRPMDDQLPFHPLPPGPPLSCPAASQHRGNLVCTCKVLVLLLPEPQGHGLALHCPPHPVLSATLLTDSIKERTVSECLHGLCVMPHEWALTLVPAPDLLRGSPSSFFWAEPPASFPCHPKTSSNSSNSPQQPQRVKEGLSCPFFWGGSTMVGTGGRMRASQGVGGI